MKNLKVLFTMVAVLVSSAFVFSCNDDDGVEAGNITLGKTEVTLAYDQTTASELVTVGTTNGAGWSATATQGNWFTVDQQETGFTVTATSALSQTDAERTGTVTVTAAGCEPRTVSVKQNAYTASITPGQLSVTFGANEINVAKDVSITSPVAWHAEPSVSWIKAEPNAAGTSVAISITEPNTTQGPKTGKVVIVADENENLTAEIGVSVEGITYYVTYSYEGEAGPQIYLPAAAGQYTIKIETNINVNDQNFGIYGPEVEPDWINGFSRSGEYEFTVTVSENSSSVKRFALYTASTAAVVQANAYDAFVINQLPKTISPLEEYLRTFTFTGVNGAVLPTDPEEEFEVTIYDDPEIETEHCYMWSKWPLMVSETSYDDLELNIYYNPERGCLYFPLVRWGQLEDGSYQAQIPWGFNKQEAYEAVEYLEGYYDIVNEKVVFQAINEFASFILYTFGNYNPETGLCQGFYGPAYANMELVPALGGRSAKSEIKSAYSPKNRLDVEMAQRAYRGENVAPNLVRVF